MILVFDSQPTRLEQAASRRILLAVNNTSLPKTNFRITRQTSLSYNAE